MLIKPSGFQLLTCAILTIWGDIEIYNGFMASGLALIVVSVVLYAFLSFGDE